MPRLTPLDPTELQERAQQYGGAALSKLAGLMRSSKTTPAVQLSAARAILERGYGRPASLRGDEAEEAAFTVLLENYGDDDAVQDGGA
jgi:hypothetical protein